MDIDMKNMVLMDMDVVDTDKYKDTDKDKDKDRSGQISTDLGRFDIVDI